MAERIGRFDPLSRKLAEKFWPGPLTLVLPLRAEAATNLFSFLLALDRTGAAAIAVEPVPMEGLGEAINDRLARAAAPRDKPVSAN
jgi:tRNA A37 threonylcarbamoyladenosine synthetase subunit TsaC/SUA5/YrdC